MADVFDVVLGHVCNVLVASLHEALSLLNAAGVIVEERRRQQAGTSLHKIHCNIAQSHGSILRLREQSATGSDPLCRQWWDKCT